MSSSTFNAGLRMLLFHKIYLIIIHCCHSERAREESRALVVVSVTVFINLANRTALWLCAERVQLRTLHYTIPSSWSLFYINLFLEFCQEKGKIDFPFLMKTEEFTNKLEEIYPKLQNQCYLLMKADKSNKLQYLDIASSSYNPKDIYDSNLGQGRLYIRFATETEVMS